MTNVYMFELPISILRDTDIKLNVKSYKELLKSYKIIIFIDSVALKGFAAQTPIRKFYGVTSHMPDDIFQL